MTPGENSHPDDGHQDNFFVIEKGLTLPHSRVIRNPDHDFFMELLRPYYIITADGQFLFGSDQPGRRPDRAFYMVPEGYRLGYGQQGLNREIGQVVYEVALRYLRESPAKVIVQDGIQGEGDFRTGMRFVTSIRNPHAGYIAWMGKLMVFPPDGSVETRCWNYIIREPMDPEYVREIREAWPDFNPREALTLYDLTRMEEDRRRVLNLGIDYFGGAFKKPNLTMVWHRAEAMGYISYHAGCTSSRVLKGLSGTGKTTLTVGPDLEQDDAVVGRPVYDGRGGDGNGDQGGHITAVELVGLEAASYAKSEGLNEGSPEWTGLMKSRIPGHIVLAQNIDCEGVRYIREYIEGYEVKIPRLSKDGGKVGSLQCDRYEKSGTTNGRFIFQFTELNRDWGKNPGKQNLILSESLSFKRFDVLEPMLRVTDPCMAVALDSGCESIITSAVAGKIPGSRVRSYAATDFMAREQAQLALLKLKMYRDMDIGLAGRLAFFIINSGYVGEFDIDGKQLRRYDSFGEPIPVVDPATNDIKRNSMGEIVYHGQGEKIKVDDSKRLIELVESRKIKRWIINPIYGYLVPDPRELEETHGMKGFARRFNPLRFYSPIQIIDFARRDIRERTAYLEELFNGQEGAGELDDVIHVWENIRLPSPDDIFEFYIENYSR